ncbi:MAG: ABC transporter permease, partial [Mycobacterium sp.]
AAVLIAVAYQLLARRDVGAGMIAERPGRGGARAGLRGPLSLAWRLDRGALLLWTVGLALYGAVFGSVVHGIGDEIGGGAGVRDIVARLGGSAVLENAFLTIAFTMLAFMASAFAISLKLRAHHEESSQHAETLLAGAVSRTRWLAGHLVIAVLGSAAALLIAGLAAGLSYGAAAGDTGEKLPAVLGTAAVQLPAVWLLPAVTVLFFGVAPRFTPVAWGVLVAFVALFLLGSLSGFPQWMLDMVPYAHTPRVGTGEFTAAPLVWLLVIDVVLAAAGVIAFRRRDLR